MRVLVTRPEADAAEMKSALEKVGVSVSLAPLIDIQFDDIAPDALEGAAALIATSRNGLRSLARSKACNNLLALPIFTVGRATEDMARALGFKTVVSGAGTASALAETIAAYYGGVTPASPLVLLAGDHVAFDLESALGEHGITVLPHQVYRANAVRSLAAPVAADLSRGAIDAVILMSPRTADIWVGLAESVGGARGLSPIAHVCLSQSVADRLPRRLGLKIAVAREPTGMHIVDVVRRLAAGDKTE